MAGEKKVCKEGGVYIKELWYTLRNFQISFLWKKKKMWKEGIPLVTAKKFPKPYRTCFMEKKKCDMRELRLFLFVDEIV